MLAGAVWSMRVPVGDGFAMHFLLASALTLMHGWHLAVVGLAVVAGARCALTGGWDVWPLLFVTRAVVPATVSIGWHELVRRYLPRNYWVYFFVTVFAGSMLAFFASGLALRSQIDDITADYFIVLAMMSFGEGTLNGFILAGAAILRPDWVATYGTSAVERR